MGFKHLSRPQDFTQLAQNRKSFAIDLALVIFHENEIKYINLI